MLLHFRYAAAYTTTVKRLVRERRELYPEAVLWAHLQSLGPPSRLLRVLRGFRASLARKQPSFHLEDPYTKIRQDLHAMGTLSREQLPAYECAAASAGAAAGGASAKGGGQASASHRAGVVGGVGGGGGAGRGRHHNRSTAKGGLRRLLRQRRQRKQRE